MRTMQGNRVQRRGEAVRAVAVVLVLACLAALGRIVTAAGCTYGSDPVGYASAVGRFDVRLYQPHPPGMLWFALLARLVMPAAGDANAALIVVAIAGSAACILLGYLLALRAFRSRSAALAAAAALAFSPLLWFYSSVAECYIWDALNSLVALNLAFWATEVGTLGPVAALSGSLGLLGGLRPYGTIFLLPLWAVVVLRGRKPAAAAALGVPLLGVGVLTWLSATALLSGGWKAYLASCRHQASGVGWMVGNAPVGLLANLKNMVAWGVVGMGAFTFPLVWALWRKRMEARAALTGQAGAVWLWGAALIPAAVFNLVGTYMADAGFMLILLTAMIVMGAGIVDAGLRSERGVRSLPVVMFVIVVANCAFFLLARPVPVNLAVTWSLPSWGLRLARQANRTLLDFTWGEIRDNDEFCRQWQSYVRTHFSPADTVLVVEEAAGRREYSRTIRYYAGEYPVLGLGHSRQRHSLYRSGGGLQRGGRVVVVPAQARRLVWLVEDLPLGVDAKTRDLFVHRAMLRSRARQMRVLELPTSRLAASYMGFRLIQERNTTGSVRPRR